MSSTDKQGSSLGSFPTSPPLYPHFNWHSGFWPCVKSCLVGGSDKYRPTNVSEETELVTFYEELSSLVRSIPKHNLLVIGGDMNAQIGKNRNNKYSLHNTSNRNGQHLIDFMIENRLTCLNTNFQKSEGKLSTYTYVNKSKAQTTSL